MSDLISYRKVKADSMEARLELWHTYVQLQIFIQLFVSWMKVLLVPTIISATSTIIICFYVTVRHSNVPAWVFLTFIYVGVTIFGIVLLLSYQLMLGIHASESSIGVLASTDGEDYRDLPLSLKKYVLKRGKATRPLRYRVGELMDFSWEVPIGIWDEILNQLLFLLSF